MIDTYYDDFNISLTSNDLWLRKRNSYFELKWPQCAGVPSVDTSSSAIAAYNESSNWEVICSVIKKYTHLELDTPPDHVLHTTTTSITSDCGITLWLQEKNIVPFAVIETHRTRYPVSIFLSAFNLSLKVNVDIDKVKFIADNDKHVNDDNNDHNNHDNKDDDNASEDDKYICKYDYSLGEVELLSRLPADLDPAAVMTAVQRDLGIPPSSSSSLSPPSSLPLSPPPPPQEEGTVVSYPMGEQQQQEQQQEEQNSSLVATTVTEVTGVTAMTTSFSSSFSSSAATSADAPGAGARRGKVEEFLLRFRPWHHQRLFGTAQAQGVQPRDSQPANPSHQQEAYIAYTGEDDI